MAKFIHITYVVIISVLAILLWQESSRESDERVSGEDRLNTQLATQLENSATNLEALVGELQAENRTLEEQLLEQEHLLTELRSELGEVALIEENQPENRRDVDELRSNSSEALARAVQNAQEGYLSNDDMAIRRELEPVDPDWAYPIEQSLQDFFIREEEFRHLNLTSLECRTSYCELSLQLSEPSESFNTSVLYRYLKSEDWFNNGTIMAFENQEAGTATVIIETKRKVE
ncbi:hypothetical protein A28LD_0440 [Idiomarina sp. A28L]|uniref:hypothetical protein n=1 Tax=Idiomarina sp. A28L TaxID=1036674 RepID=UPI0002138B7F|nr:hypothetical protein [Idiomarina sp. A28L]EGN75952.1 hypothetical protein A28LD_0440 [Idiomarina sp. A28L]